MKVENSPKATIVECSDQLPREQGFLSLCGDIIFFRHDPKPQILRFHGLIA
jgi:hypothetical protein